MKMRSMSVILATILSIPYMSGCSRTPLYLDTGFKPVKKQQLMILHCVDARKDKTSTKLNEGDLDKIIDNWTIRYSLSSRGFKVVSDKRTTAAMPTAELISDMNDNELIALAPKEAELAYLFILDDLVVEFSVIAKTAKAEGHAYIIDTRAGKVVWKDREVFTQGGLGLAFGFVPMRDASIQQCATNMIFSIPKCSGK